MSAKQIPNLNTLRRGGGGLRARLRNRGGREAADASADDISTPQKHKQTLPPAAKDGIIQGTDNDASVSRLSAVDMGYLHDDFARTLTPAVGGPGSRRFPIINRGTYVRTVAIDDLVNRFLDGDESQPPMKKQIISLGAGSDTRPFRILGKQAKGHVVYHEIDFPANTSAKIRSIRASPLLQAALQADQEGINSDNNENHATNNTLHLPNYHIHAVDLRTLAAEARRNSIDTRPSATDDSSEILETNTNTSTANPTQELLTGINPALPTLIISECCLMYLSSDDADAALDYFTYKFFPSTTPVGIIIYEPIRPEDAFGKTMISNLAARGIQLQTLSKYASLSAQRQRCLDHGFKSDQKAVDIDFVWNNWISDIEKRRVATLEMLDEIEEWRLLAQHYCMVWAWREVETADIEVFRRWRDVRSE